METHETASGHTATDWRKQRMSERHGKWEIVLPCWLAVSLSLELVALTSRPVSTWDKDVRVRLVHVLGDCIHAHAAVHVNE